MPSRGRPSRLFVYYVRSVATFGGAGMSPWAPGTIGSAAGLLLAWVMPGGWIFAGLLFLLILMGFGVCRDAVKVFDNEDPKCFVMDEVCGMMISVFWVPKTAAAYLAGFILFRLLDIFKPWPISRVQQWRHPSAIMWDDVLAGVFANLFIQLYFRVLP